MTLGPTFARHWPTDEERNRAIYRRALVSHIIVALVLLATVSAGFWLGYATRPLICLDSTPHTFCN